MPVSLTDIPPSSACVFAHTRCLTCGNRLAAPRCEYCDRGYVFKEGILHAIGSLRGTNAIAVGFYDGPTWPRFRHWEQIFLWFQGPGIVRARRQVLCHLPQSCLRILEVGIGDGENISLLPPAAEIFGVDIALGRLQACENRFPICSGRLAWAEAEALPFEDDFFDAAFTVGGINYFSDPSRALAEMRRVVRPGGTVVAADELPDLYRYNLGYMLGLEGLDQWTLRLIGLEPAFIAMVYETPARVEAAARDIWPNHCRIPIWNRLGYCLVDLVED